MANAINLAEVGSKAYESSDKILVVTDDGYVKQTEAGKGLSTNDYDAAAKAKVDAIPADPKYTDTVYDDSELKAGLEWNTQQIDDIMGAVGKEGYGPIKNAVLHDTGFAQLTGQISPLADCRYYTIPCEAGDKFWIKTQGGVNVPYYNWYKTETIGKDSFLATSGQLTATTVATLEVVAPTGAKLLVVNCRYKSSEMTVKKWGLVPMEPVEGYVQSYVQEQILPVKYAEAWDKVGDEFFTNGSYYRRGTGTKETNSLTRSTPLFTFSNDTVISGYSGGSQYTSYSPITFFDANERYISDYWTDPAGMKTIRLGDIDVPENAKYIAVNTLTTFLSQSKVSNRLGTLKSIGDEMANIRENIVPTMQTLLNYEDDIRSINGIYNELTATYSVKNKVVAIYLPKVNQPADDDFFIRITRESGDAIPNDTIYIYKCEENGTTLMTQIGTYNVATSPWYRINRDPERTRLYLYRPGATGTFEDYPQLKVEYKTASNLNDRMNDLKAFVENQGGMWTNKNIVCFGDSLTEFKDDSGKQYSEYVGELLGANMFNCGIGGTQFRHRQAKTFEVFDASKSYEVGALVWHTDGSGVVRAYKATVAHNGTWDESHFSEWANNSSFGYDGIDIYNMVHAACTGNYENVKAAAKYVTRTASDNNEAIVERLSNIDWDTIDAVTFFAGTNDWNNASTAWGTPESTDPYYTFGAIRKIIEEMSTAHPNVKIFWFTPVPRWIQVTVDGVNNVRLPENFSDVLKKGTGDAARTLQELARDIAALVTEYHIPVCNMYDIGWNTMNFSNYFNDTDGTHPRKPAGMFNLALKVAGFLNDCGNSNCGPDTQKLLNLQKELDRELYYIKTGEPDVRIEHYTDAKAGSIHSSNKSNWPTYTTARDTGYFPSSECSVVEGKTKDWYFNAAAYRLLFVYYHEDGTLAGNSAWQDESPAKINYQGLDTDTVVISLRARAGNILWTEYTDYDLYSSLIISNPIVYEETLNQALTSEKVGVKQIDLGPIYMATRQKGYYYSVDSTDTLIKAANTTSYYGILDLSNYRGKILRVRAQQNTLALSSVRGWGYVDSLDVDSAKVLSKLKTEADLFTTTEPYWFEYSTVISESYLCYSTAASILEIAVEEDVIAKRVEESISLSGKKDYAYVAVNGSDEHGDGSRENPYASINEAIKNGSNTIYVGPGTYKGSITTAFKNRHITIIPTHKTESVIIRPKDEDCILSQTEEKVAGYTNVYRFAMNTSLSSETRWIYQEGVSEESTLISEIERHPLQRGRKYRCDDTRIVVCSATSLESALSEIDTSDTYKYYVDAENGYMYLSRPAAITSSNPICHSKSILLFGSGCLDRSNTFDVTGIETKYLVFNIHYTTNSVIRDCKSSNVMGAGAFVYDSALGCTFIRCEACHAQRSGNGDGFNGHATNVGDIYSKQCTTYLVDCWSHDNYDDGYSDHERAEICIHGGLYEYNGKAGITPSYGSHCSCYNVYSRQNYCGFYYTGVAVAAEGGEGGQMICYNCVAENNRRGPSRHGFKVDGDNNKAILINCKSIGNNYGYGTGATASMQLIDCTALNNVNGIKEAGSNITVMNTELVVE